MNDTEKRLWRYRHGFFYGMKWELMEEGKEMLLSKEQKKDLLKKLMACSEKASDLEEGAEDLNSEVYINYSMQTETGNAFYRSFDIVKIS